MDITMFVEIEKFIEYNLNERIVDKNKENRRKISGTFKEKGSNELNENDIFMAYELMHSSALEVYRCYVEYFNYTIQRPGEKERIAVSAKWIKTKEGEK